MVASCSGASRAEPEMDLRNSRRSLFVPQSPDNVDEGV
jgi:hypothetical protein